MTEQNTPTVQYQEHSYTAQFTVTDHPVIDSPNGGKNGRVRRYQPDRLTLYWDDRPRWVDRGQAERGGWCPQPNVRLEGASVRSDGRLGVGRVHHYFAWWDDVPEWIKEVAREYAPAGVIQTPVQD